VKITTVIRELNAAARDLVDYTHLEGKTKTKEITSLQACQVLREILL
jgi:hypothetical protein